MVGDSNFVQSAGSIAYFVGFLILFNCGDASQVSYKTLQLIFAQLMLEIPPVFLPGLNPYDLIRYVWNIFVITWIVRYFRTPGSKFHDTYRRDIDDFPLHWLFLPVAAVVPLIATFLPYELDPYDLDYKWGVCPKLFWQLSAVAAEETSISEAAEMDWECTLRYLWMTSICLRPLMFIPQLRMCSNLNADLMFSVKMFLVCMIVYVSAVIVLDLSLPYSGRFVSLVSSAVTLFILGMPVCGCCPRRSQETSAVPTVPTSEDVGIEAGESELPLTEDPEIDLPTITASSGTFYDSQTPSLLT